MSTGSFKYSIIHVRGISGQWHTVEYTDITTSQWCQWHTRIHRHYNMTVESMTHCTIHWYYNITVESFVTQIFNNGHGGDRKTFDVMTSTELRETLGSVSSLLSTTLYQGNPDRTHKLWEIYTPYAGAAEMLLHMNGKFTMGKLKSLISFDFYELM